MITLASPFTDGAVFQRRRMVPVWGYAAPNAEIQAVFAGNTATIRANRSGQFLLRLAPMEAGGPYDLVVRDLTHNEQIRIHDVLVGEVWLASGQSNMEYPLRGGWNPADSAYEILPQHAEFLDELKKIPADYLRFLHVPRNASGVREDSFNAVWKKVSNQKEMEAFSAIALWFALKLIQYENVPVGMIGSYWGGTSVEAWTSREMMLNDPEDSKRIQQLDEIYYLEKGWLGDTPQTNLQDACRKHCPADPDYSREILAETLKPLGRDWQSFLVPGLWTSRSIAGNGVVWVCRSVQIPASWQNRDLEFHTGGIDKHDISFFNGQEIGRTGSDFDCSVFDNKRCYRIPADLVKSGQDNVVAIRGYSFIYGGGFVGSEEDYYLSCGDERIELAGEWYCRVEVDHGFISLPAAVCGRDNPNTPGILFDGMIAPLIPYAINGVIWYQGENNAHGTEAIHYADQMQNMIRDWRFRFGCGDFAFYQVQLAGFYEQDSIAAKCGWAYLRESQQIACDKMKNVGLISAIDIGE